MTTHPSKRLVSFMHFTSCPIITTAWDPQGPACAEMFALSCISHPALRLRRDSSCQAPEWFGGGGRGVGLREDSTRRSLLYCSHAHVEQDTQHFAPHARIIIIHTAHFWCVFAVQNAFLHHFAHFRI